MKRLYLGIIFCTLLFLCGCQKNKGVNTELYTEETKGNYEIKVTCSSWSGWSSDYEPVEERFVYPAQEGVIVKPDNDNIISGTLGDFEFEIVEISSKEIVIKTNQPMSCDSVDSNTIDLNTKETIFEIKKGEKIKLTTPTTDAGDIYIIEY